jgi:quercetin dioxygenase-like cupin family protein
MVRKYRPEEVPAVYNIEELPVHSHTEGIEQRYFRGLDSLVGFTTISEGKEAVPHSHPWEQINFVLDGACSFHVGEETVTADEGDVFLVPPDVPHCAEYTGEPCTIMFVGPLREDYAAKTAYQREFGSD